MSLHQVCRVCTASGTFPEYTATEKMFGLGGSFKYFKCEACGCLQSESVDLDLAPYYPTNYYSFTAQLKGTGFRGWLMKERDRAALGTSTLIGRWMHDLRPNAPLSALRRLQLRRTDKLADVGCGAGVVLRQLSLLGFSDLTGIDPNIDRSIDVSDHLRILKCSLSDVEGAFDLLMFHHSLEHIPDQVNIMHEAFDRLKPGGHCVIRIPLVSSQAWDSYGLNWVQLDAPRHMYLHSESSMMGLAQRSGFEIVSVTYDSDDFQFWGSEALSRGLTLVDKTSGLPNPEAQMISRRGRTEWRRQAKTLNGIQRGDQASFILRKPPLSDSTTSS